MKEFLFFIRWGLIFLNVVAVTNKAKMALFLNLEKNLRLKKNK